EAVLLEPRLDPLEAGELVGLPGQPYPPGDRPRAVHEARTGDLGQESSFWRAGFGHVVPFSRPQPRFARGSSASLRPSPKRLNARIASMITAPGNTETCSALRRYLRPSLSIAPHPGVGGRAPRPRKPRYEADRIAVRLLRDRKSVV